MKKENIIKNKSFDFALKIIQLFKTLQASKEFIMSKQLLRAGTSIGAMIREAEHAESSPDFIHKLAIAQKEANETAYWLELLHHSGYITNENFQNLSHDIDELQKICASIILTVKTVQRKNEIS